MKLESLTLTLSVCLCVQAGRLYVLVSLMLSSQTRDEVNHAAMVRLREAGLSLPWLNAVPEQRLAEIIRPVGFWRVRRVIAEVDTVLRTSEERGFPREW